MQITIFLEETSNILHFSFESCYFYSHEYLNILHRRVVVIVQQTRESEAKIRNFI